MSIMFKYENELMPVPSYGLEEIMERYLECILPIVDDEVYRNTDKICRNFIENDGKLLFEKVLEWKDALNGGSWLLPKQMEGLLSEREPLTLMGNYAGILKPDNNSHINDSVELTAAFIYAAIKIYIEIECETFKPILIKDRIPVSMKQFKDVFNSCRVPKKGHDEIISYSKDVDKSRSVCFFYNGRYWNIEVVNSEGIICKYKDLLSTIKTIIYSSREKNANHINHISILGSDKASYYIDKLTGYDEKNMEGFNKLYSSVFNISYSGEKIMSEEEEMHDILYGNGENFWCYKPWSICMKKDRRIRYNMEHTLMDGLNSIYLLGLIREFISNKDSFTNENNGTVLNHSLIEWNISDSIKNEILAEKNEYLDTVSRLGTKKIVFDGYGKEKIAGSGYSADAIFRFALQYAQKKVYNEIRTEYESCDIRHFYEGRVMGIRPVSEESISLVDSVINNDCKDTITEKLESANNSHKNKIKKCKQANSVTRPLNVLKSIYEKYGEELGIKEMPELFSDISFEKINSDFLSTTTVGDWDSMFFSPVIENGIGLVYAIKDNSIEFFVTFRVVDEENINSFCDEVKEFLDIIEEYLI
ncbi:Choline/Carnitine o-acyltransferase [Dethiosulfatibacter aminovorans DSM 17477]|uniref:Choline/Carnitine o-acyltransferase n=1 Tax=Dethiosulfatibacter aminovorans DSM 17477 TaxID=1121476 RepID=A0A1M6M4A8_9FIRM|nr:choline/carnitine O-acyltransferase [Dethiosulfatibacter aminovorans]SHJ78210.1 Choline/Carnitine o-acyltransferase [Dethiosulfatibacter aminovorans DSM 17477]